jgi:hypothetical protein
MEILGFNREPQPDELLVYDYIEFIKANICTESTSNT